MNATETPIVGSLEPVVVHSSRQCKKCNKPKELGEFRKNSYKCRKCESSERVARKQSRPRNMERERELSARRYHANPERFSATKRRYYLRQVQMAKQSQTCMRCKCFLDTDKGGLCKSCYRELRPAIIAAMSKTKI